MAAVKEGGQTHPFRQRPDEEPRDVGVDQESARRVIRRHQRLVPVVDLITTAISQRGTMTRVIEKQRVTGQRVVREPAEAFDEVFMRWIAMRLGRDVRRRRKVCQQHLLMEAQLQQPRMNPFHVVDWAIEVIRGARVPDPAH